MLKRAGFIELFAHALKLRKRFRVEGNSMLPVLKPDDQVLILRISPDLLMPGDIVVARHPHQRDVTMIKQIESIREDGKFILSGLNLDESTDSRQFGSVDQTDVIGKVVSIV